MWDMFNLTVEDYLAKAPRYIGTERGPSQESDSDSLKCYQTALGIVAKLEEESPRHARLTRRYFLDMRKVLFEMQRVLRQGKYAIVVVCPSHIRKIVIPTHEVFAEIGNGVGLKLKRQYSRTINERRRLLPYVKKSFGTRMDAEYVLIFQKK
jgi:hypothetical protein